MVSKTEVYTMYIHLHVYLYVYIVYVCATCIAAVYDILHARYSVHVYSEPT